MPLIYSRYASRFLELKSSSTSCEVTGRRLNRGGGYGLEVPCKYKLQGVPEAVDWVAKCMDKETGKIKNAIERNQDTKEESKRLVRGCVNESSCEVYKTRTETLIIPKCHVWYILSSPETFLWSDCAIFRSVINLCKHPVSVLRGFGTKILNKSVRCPV